MLLCSYKSISNQPESWKDQSLWHLLTTRGQTLNAGTYPWWSVSSHSQPSLASQPPVIPPSAWQAWQGLIGAGPQAGRNWEWVAADTAPFPGGRGLASLANLLCSVPQARRQQLAHCLPSWWWGCHEGRRRGEGGEPQGGRGLMMVALANGVCSFHTRLHLPWSALPWLAQSTSQA